MNLFVCVKSVPDSQTITFDQETGTLRREGSVSVINPYDLVAVETALQCMEHYGGILKAVSMGPSSAQSGLRTALAMGAQEAYLLQSRRFAGADVPATAYTLAGFFRSFSPFDLIICGKHSTDGDTGQTGAMIAEFLHLPHVSMVQKIIYSDKTSICVQQRLDNMEQEVLVKLPCLLTVENNISVPRSPTLAGILRAKKAEIHLVDENHLTYLDPSRCGFSGSATRVQKVTVATQKRAGKMLSIDQLGMLVPLFEKRGAGHNG